MTVPRWFPRLVLALAVVAAAAWAATHRQAFDAAGIETFVRDLGPLAPLGYVGLYAVATVLFVPGTLFGLAGGVLFGPLWGTLWNLIGASIGATLAFLVARYLAADWVRQRAGGRLGRLIAGVEAEGWRFVAFVRLVPLFPFNLLNYALGLTRIPLIAYLLASVVCMAPATAAFTWLGYAGREAATGSGEALRWGVLALGALAAIAFLPRLWRRLRGGSAAPGPSSSAESPWLETAELKRRLDAGEALAVLDVRGADEFTGPFGHIASALNLPVEALAGRLGELSAWKELPLAIVCRTDRRSMKAAELLRGAGFAQVMILRGGMTAWNRAGLPRQGATQP
jgi:uncharacterized membrane protein YdjX (TVP38/TMEM64 family)/rhodanese-related sulfurtransferase